MHSHGVGRGTAAHARGLGRGRGAVRADGQKGAELAHSLVAEVEDDDEDDARDDERAHRVGRRRRDRRRRIHEHGAREHGERVYFYFVLKQARVLYGKISNTFERKL